MQHWEHALLAVIITIAAASITTSVVMMPPLVSLDGAGAENAKGCHTRDLRHARLEVHMNGGTASITVLHFRKTMSLAANQTGAGAENASNSPLQVIPHLAPVQRGEHTTTQKVESISFHGLAPP